jgi:WD40 repeat protein
MKVLSVQNRFVVSGIPSKNYLPKSLLQIHNKNIKYTNGNSNFIFEFGSQVQNEYFGSQFDWSPDQNYILSWYEDQNNNFSSNVILYDVSQIDSNKEPNQIKKIIFDNPDRVQKVKFSPDGKKFAILIAPNIEMDDGSPSKILIYSLDKFLTDSTNTPDNIIIPSDYPIMSQMLPSFDWDSNSNVVYVGTITPIQNLIFESPISGNMGVVLGIDVTSGDLIKLFYLDPNEETIIDLLYFGYMIKVSPSGNKIAIGTEFDAVFIFELSNQYENNVFSNKFVLSYYNFEFSPNGSIFSIGYEYLGSYFVNIYDDLSQLEPISSGLISSPEIQEKFGSSISWSPDGTKIAINLLVDFYGEGGGGVLGTVYIYDTTNFQEIKTITLSDNSDFARFIKYSPDSKYLAINKWINFNFYE